MASGQEDFKVLAKKHCPKPGHSAFEGRRCLRCEKERDKARGSASKRGYDEDWKRKRFEYLLQYPNCSEPECGLPATEVDHILSIDQRPDLRLDESNFRGFCKPHHSARTGRDQVTWNRKSA